MTKLPEITNGTEKQNAYADAIRAAVFAGIVARVPAEKHEGFAAHFGGIMTTDAVRWIEAYKTSGKVLGRPGEAIVYDARVDAMVKTLTK